MLRQTMDEKRVREAARELAQKLRGFSPEIVVYVAEGGAAAGLAVAEELEIPSAALDLSYPATRFFRRFPPFLAAIAGPVKELLYRATRPKLNARPVGITAGARVALVDDSASTGRTLKAAAAALAEIGVKREMVSVAVLRCGKRARGLVDHFVF